MKTSAKIAVLVLWGAILASCGKFPQSPEGVGRPGNVISISVGAVAPDYSDVDNPGTKITFDGAKYEWEGTESMKVLVGNTSTSNLAGGVQATIPSTAEGVFGGSIDLGDFSYSDIQAVVVPSDPAAYYYYSSKGEHRIRIPLSYEQTQALEGVMNVSYAPVFARLQLDEAPSGDYSVDGLSMKAATYAVRFNVYAGTGGIAAGEILKSVSLKFNTKRESFYEGRFNADGSISNIYQSGTTTDTWKVSLTEEKGIPEEKTDGLKLFLSVNPKFSIIEGVEVETDKAIYSKAVSKSLGDDSAARNLLPGQMFQFALNLSSFSKASYNAIHYSTDGGSWSDDIPASFSSLYVKTDGTAVVDSAALAGIVAAMKAQGAAVDLDMSEAVYESTAFPAWAFKGTVNSAGGSSAFTVKTPVTCIKSMVFPSNVTEIEANAFAGDTSLESVDLTGIKTINGSAFRNTGLKTLTVPSSVTYCGTYAFAYLTELETCQWGAKLPDSGSGRGDYCFAFRTGTDDNAVNRAKNAVEGKNGLVFTVASTCGVMGSYLFDTNTKLTKIVFDNANVWTAGNVFIRAINLAEVEFKNGSGARTPYATLGSNTLYVSNPPYTGDYNIDSGGALNADNRNNVGRNVSSGKTIVFDNNATFPARITNQRRTSFFRKLVHRGFEMPLCYSSDGNAWQAEIPDSFTTLFVMGNPLSLNDLTAIRAAALAQGVAVTLDFAGTLYESTAFPDTFNGDTDITIAQKPVNCL